MTGAPFYESGVQEGIKGPIILACGGKELCLGFDAVIDKKDEEGEEGDPQCRISGLPQEGVEVPRGTVLKFKVLKPCDHKDGKSHDRGKTKSPKPSPPPTPTPVPTPTPAGSG